MGNNKAVRRIGFAGRRSAAAVVVILGTCFLVAGWYFVVRPNSLCNSARELLDENPRESIRLLEEAQAARGGNIPVAQILMSRALLRLGDRDKAMGFFRVAQAGGDVPYSEVLRLADDAAGVKSFQIAFAAYSALLDEPTVRSPALSGLISLLYNQQEFAAVVELGERLTADDSPEAVLQVAQSYESLGDFSNAVSRFEEYLAVAKADAPHQVAAMRGMLRVSIILGDGIAARSWLAQVRKLAHEPIPLDYVLEAKLLRMEGQTVEAETLLERVFMSMPDFPPAIEVVGDLAIDRADWVTAKSSLERVIAYDEWNAAAHYKLGRTLRHLGLKKQADGHLDKSRKLTYARQQILSLQRLASADAEQLRQLAAAYSAIGQSEKAAAVTEALNAKTTSELGER